MSKHFLQSTAREKYINLEGKATFRLEAPDFEAMAILETTPLGNYLFCPYGPNLLGENPHASLRTSLKALKTLAKEQKAFFVRIEPTIPFSNNTDQNDESVFTPDFMRSLGLKKSHDIEPAHTWALDLSQSEEDLLHEMPYSRIQYWHSAEKKGLKLRTTKDPKEITVLTSLLAEVSEKNHFNPQEENHLKNQLKSGFATLYIAEYDGQPLAASLIYDHNGIRYYAHSASSRKNKKLSKLSAGTVVLIQEIVDAKRQGFESFDFWGITTSKDPNHPWYGFTAYKKSFGGQQIDFSGTWDLPLNSLHYRLYRLIRKINRKRRKK